MSDLYAVVDAARDRRIYDLVHQALFPACLFRTDVVSPMGRNAPYLVPVEHAERLDRGLAQDRARRKLGHLPSFVARSRRACASGCAPSTRRNCLTAESSSSAGGTRASSASICRLATPTISTQWFASVEEYICETEDGAGFTIYRHGDGALRKSERSAWNVF